MISGIFRYKGHGSLRYVFSKGQAVRSPLFTIKYIANNHRKNCRFSVVISKKVLKSAVGRNRVRRRIYEYLRLHQPQINNIYDIVIICTSSEMRSMPATELYDYLDQLFIKTELYKKS